MHAEAAGDATAAATPHAEAGPGLRRRATRVLLRCSGLAVLLLVWWLATVAGLTPSDTIPGPVSTFDAFGSLIVDGATLTAIGETVAGAAAGFAIALVIAVPLGLVMGLYRPVEEATVVVVEFLKPVPPIVVLPLALLALGATFRMKVVLVGFGAFWPLLTSALAGARATDQLALDTARVFRIGRIRTLARVILPATAPFIGTGARISATIAFLVAITAELVGGAPGLGLSLLRAQGAGAYADTFALVLLTGLLGVAINLLVTRVERVAAARRPPTGAGPR